MPRDARINDAACNEYDADGQPPTARLGQRVLHGCRLRRFMPQPNAGPPDAVLQTGAQFDESYIPRAAVARHCPPPSVHTRFHPVPTHPVFGGPPGQDARPRPEMEQLPREYNSTPRRESTPKPHYDWDEHLEREKKLKDAEQKEERPLPIYNYW